MSHDAYKKLLVRNLKNSSVKDYSRGSTAVDKIYEYIDGEIETLETDFETDNYAMW